MRIGVVGSRSFDNYDLMQKTLADLGPTVIVSGGAKGADTLAARYAQENGLELIEFKPNWKLGRHASLLRNTQIVEASDFVLAFWDGKSTGTQDSVKKAVDRGIPYRVILF